jgi:hypothetical protein
MQGLQGRIKSADATTFTGQLDLGYDATHDHTYGAIAAGPDNSFHIVYRNSNYLNHSGQAMVSHGGTGLSDGEGPRIAVSSQGRIIGCAFNGNTREKVGTSWVSRGKPVSGVECYIPALAADRSGNVYITDYYGKMAILKQGQNSWSSPISLPNAKSTGYTRPAEGAASGTYVIYEGNDGLYIAYVSPDGNIGGLTDGPAMIVNDKQSDGVGVIDVFPNPFNPAVTILVKNNYVGAVCRGGILTNEGFHVKNTTPTFIPPLQAFIYDIHGRIITRIKTDKNNQNRYTWNAIAHPPGLYLLKIKSENKTYTKKVILEK